jgi:hypothetical protein
MQNRAVQFYIAARQQGAVDCGEFKAAERLIATALSGNPPEEIAEELKDLFIQINLRPYLERNGINIDNEKINALILKSK